MADNSSLSIDRALRQELEGWRRAGLSHLPMPPRKRSAAVPAATSTKPSTTRTPTGNSVGSRAAASPSAPATRAAPRPATAPAAMTTHSLPVVSESLSPSPHPAGSREDREWRLNQLRQRVAACTRCQELASARTQTVFGVGNPEARFMFIGEAPGADEDAQGDRKSTRLNSSHLRLSRMPSSA